MQIVTAQCWHVTFLHDDEARWLMLLLTIVHLVEQSVSPVDALLAPVRTVYLRRPY